MIAKKTMGASNDDINFLISRKYNNDKGVYAFSIKAKFTPQMMPAVCDLCCISY